MWWGPPAHLHATALAPSPSSTWDMSTWQARAQWRQLLSPSPSAWRRCQVCRFPAECGYFYTVGASCVLFCRLKWPHTSPGSMFIQVNPTESDWATFGRDLAGFEKHLGWFCCKPGNPASQTHTCRTSANLLKRNNASWYTVSLRMWCVLFGMRL